MIRINLLPVRQVRRAQAGRRHALIAAGALGVQAVLMFGIYENEDSEVERRKRSVSVIQQDIDRLKQDVGDFDTLREQRDRLLKQRKVINELHQGRTGPVLAMRELSDILSAGKGPTVDAAAYEQLTRMDPTAGYNPRWQPRRVWIESFNEGRGGHLTILGRAKDHDDVAELLKRLSLSNFFSNVRLDRNALVTDSRMGTKVVRFSLSCKLTFRGA